VNLFLTILVQQLDQYLPDGGPVYAETNIDAFISEPWNAISSLAIVFPAVYWAIRLKFNFKDYQFIYLSIPLLIAGGLGSLLYHAFRSSVWLLYMDVLPTALLTFFVGIYFWLRLFKKWYFVFLIITPITIVRLYLLFNLDGEFAVNLNYLITGSLIFLPVLIYLFRHSFRYALNIFVSVFFLILSLYFREIDQISVTSLPMGTHFLWHIFSGIGAYFLANYLYLIRHEELNNQRH